MTLRRELSLFFGGLLLIVLGLVITHNSLSLYRILADGLKKQFSPDPFLQIAEVERSLLMERARSLVSNQQVNTFRRNLISGLEGSGTSEEVLEQVRQSDVDPELMTLRAHLYTLYDQTLGVLHGVGVSATNDLVAIVAEEGQVLLEILGGLSYSEFAQSPELELQVVEPNLSDQEIWKIAQDRGECRGFLVYPDGNLYLYGANPFLKGNWFEGLALVGKQIDRELLHSTVQNEHIQVFVLFGDRVVGNSEDSEELGEEFAAWLSEGGALSESWTSRSGRTFLMKSRELKSFYRTPEEVELDEELIAEGLEVHPVTEVGQIIFLKDMSEVQAAARNQVLGASVIGIVTLALALLLVPLLARRFTIPIGALSNAMTEVGEGRLEQLEESTLSNIKEVREASLSFNQMVIGLRQKKALEHFVPEGTRREVEESQGATPQLGGSRIERTIMFSDLRGFTSMCEKLSADQVMEILNEYLERMTRAIRCQGGDINEYIGDAILAVFENPDSAVQAALDMNKALEDLRRETEVEDIKALGQGIGLHTGFIVEGNIGEANARLKRAVVGDTVNLAARIQDRSRDGRHTRIFLSRDTKGKLKEQVPMVIFGLEEFKGVDGPVEVWELLDT